MSEETAAESVEWPRKGLGGPGGLGEEVESGGLDRYFGGRIPAMLADVHGYLDFLFNFGCVRVGSKRAGAQ